MIAQWQKREAGAVRRSREEMRTVFDGHHLLAARCPCARLGWILERLDHARYLPVQGIKSSALQPL
jgi:hypothetical protein